MQQSRRLTWQKDACLVLGSVSAALCFVRWTPLLSADTIRLKNGNALRGQLIQETEESLTLRVGRQKVVVARHDVETLDYEPARKAPRKLPPFDLSTLAEPAKEGLLGQEFLMAIQQRLGASQHVVKNLREAWVALHYEDHEVVSAAIRRAAQAWLPLRDGAFEPITLLAQLLVLLGMRILTLWVGLILVRQPHDFIRIAEFMVPAYGLMVVLVSFWMVFATIPAMVGSILVWVLGATALFMWMFRVSPGKALLALILILQMNFWIEYGLLHTGAIKVGVTTLPAYVHTA